MLDGSIFISISNSVSQTREIAPFFPRRTGPPLPSCFTNLRGLATKGSREGSFHLHESPVNAPSVSEDSFSLLWRVGYLKFSWASLIHFSAPGIKGSPSTQRAFWSQAIMVFRYSVISLISRQPIILYGCVWPFWPPWTVCRLYTYFQLRRSLNSSSRRDVMYVPRWV